MSDETYMVIAVIIPNTNEDYEALSRVVDSIQEIATELTYQQASDILVDIEVIRPD